MNGVCNSRDFSVYKFLFTVGLLVEKASWEEVFWWALRFIYCKQGTLGKVDLLEA